MTTEKRLLEVFRGSSVAHGRTTVGRTGRNGKAEAKSKVVREPLTEEAVRLHIEGTQGIGSIPINSDNMCRFGALDIDTYDLNHKALSEKLKKLKLPLFHCRSKSGGAHLVFILKGLGACRVGTRIFDGDVYSFRFLWLRDLSKARQDPS